MLNASRVRHLMLGLLGFVLLSGTGCATDPPDALPALHIDPARVTVAGLSSGAYMATQTHMAWPRLFSGAALVAGGPWGCADGRLQQALTRCMKGEPAPDVPALVKRAEQRSRDGKLGPLSALAHDRVYVLHGRYDGVVAASVSEAAARFYSDLKAADPALADLQVHWDGKRDFGHNLPLAGKPGDDCTHSQSPYLGRCGFDAVGAIFGQLYGPAPRAAAPPGGQLMPFRQDPYRPDGRDAYLAKTGYVYVPSACANGKRCGLMVVFHGCEQNATSVGESFVRDAGFNRWADAYDVVVLYPQTRASFAPLNPKACWDWWGYSGAGYDTRQGVQQQWLRRALTALGAAPPH